MKSREKEETAVREYPFGSFLIRATDAELRQTSVVLQKKI